MESTKVVRDEQRPAIHLVDSECDALYALALAIQSKRPERAEMLLAELDRAEVVPAGKLPKGVVTMNSHVEFFDEATAKPRTVQLVYPQHADIDAGRLSILSPVGIGLIGMSEGSAILWPDRDGHQRLLRIVSVKAAEG
ncbi:nucleoside diphosphate kinase regulator [Sphingomonas soli]|uniref:nucleoside diphosphate kinase regulator n=1 Tax=Sphingomonas soli TaxID=266127 RepID=UPI000B25E7D2|nr:nucleoside diphosphate kinase regulator [Sphingomonas soli]